jgi:APA family basic amino acid/polyamine antiporter
VTRLARRLGVREAVVIGLGSMLGAGVFVVFAPAAAEAGSGPALLAALGIAGLVAYCNATGSARLAIRYPESGGTYVYGRRRLGELAGFLAGWGFVVGKTASCGAMALTIGAYLWPQQARVVAVAAVVGLTAVNLGGVAKTARATRWLVTVTLVVLAGVVVAGATAGGPQLDRVGAGEAAGAYGVLTAAGLIFFAFAGYARIATLGEEVREPTRTIPRAIPLALGIVLAIYAVVALVALAVLGPVRLAASPAPLAEVVRVGDLPALDWLVRLGAGVAVTGVLLALLAGVGRTVLAMARRGDRPRTLDAVHERYRVPHRAELVVALAVAVLVALADLRHAIGFSSVTVLVYYAITNASALTLGREPGRRLPVQSLAVVGLVGCVALSVTLPPASVLTGFAVLAVGAAWFAARRVFALRP